MVSGKLGKLLVLHPKNHQKSIQFKVCTRWSSTAPKSSSKKKTQSKIPQTSPLSIFLQSGTRTFPPSRFPVVPNFSNRGRFPSVVSAASIEVGAHAVCGPFLRNTHQTPWKSQCWKMCSRADSNVWEWEKKKVLVWWERELKISSERVSDLSECGFSSGALAQWDQTEVDSGQKRQKLLVVGWELCETERGSVSVFDEIGKKRRKRLDAVLCNFSC